MRSTQPICKIYTANPNTVPPSNFYLLLIGKQLYLLRRCCCVNMLFWQALRVSNLSVTFARSPGSSSGKYMMMPTQECTCAKSAGEAAGLMSAELLLLQRCSMGPGAGTLFSSRAFISSAMNSKSAPLGFLEAHRLVSSYQLALAKGTGSKRAQDTRGYAGIWIYVNL